MAEYASALAAPDIAEIIRTATPLNDPVKMRYSASIRRRYEQLDDFPAGYLVAADALCSFNPFYGQGMTVAALEGLVLMQLLREEREGLARRFFPAAAKLLDNPWTLALSNDLRLPHVKGLRSAAMLETAEYLHRFRAAAANDAVLATAFLRVTNMIDEPARLMAPDLKARVLRGSAMSPHREEKTA